MMIDIYTIPSNLPSRRAIQWLTDHQVAFHEHRVHPAQPKLTPVPVKELLTASENGVEDLLAPHSHAYQVLASEHNIDELPLTELIRAIEAQPSMLRFPIIFNRSQCLIQTGYSDEMIRTFVTRQERHHDLLVRLSSLTDQPPRQTD
ncbi:ArsC/Spx/MgsR family protein [Furfurilactobacillus sp. WILCCON 0119]|uniref:ArsC/Spx/MgsR family protein n=1 Tax=Furfurilactobacillus entadae TaxID=2922307 RepID=UPI0035E83330